jgi:hypothetical protein
MMHVAEERLIAYALADLEPGDRAAVEEHVRECHACGEALDELLRVLEATASADVPARASDYGARVWARLEPRLPAPRREPGRLPVPVWFAAAAILLMAVSAFLIGRWSGTPSTSTPAATSASGREPDTRSIRERVVLAALGDHFDRTERTLVELANADASRLVDISAEQAWARDLLEANRLYRQSAQGSASSALMELLGEIEPILLEIVNSPSRLTPDDVHALQARIEDRSLLFKLRVTGAHLRARQRTLTHPGEPSS